MSQGEGAMPAERFASVVVGRVLDRERWNPLRYIRSGKWTVRFWFMSWLPRTWVLSALAKRLMGPKPSP